MTIEKIIKDIPYLIKFQGNERTYAEKLISQGQLFMQSAEAYINIEKQTGIKGQGDIREGLVFDFVRIGIDLPIYCMYGVYLHQIEGNTISIDKRVVQDFCPEGGYITLIETMPFINQFKAHCSYTYDIGMVIYGRKSVAQDKRLLEKMTSALHYKSEALKYQQEFRIVVGKKLNRIVIPHEETPWIPKEVIDEGIHYHKFEEFTLEIGDISSYSHQISTDVLEDESMTHLRLSLNKI
ncbi:MAG: hypothetical protein FWE83_09465 [Oscillospiraceae bacterium]|nr:hypothetical protein [Oscillospiraceae bacterium]